MNRADAVNKIQQAADLLQDVVAALMVLGATHTMTNRVVNLMGRLDDLEIDVKQCDLLIEEADD